MENRKQPEKSMLGTLFGLLLIMLFSVAPKASSQEVALKTNLVSAASLSPALGAEIAVAPHWSVDLTGQVNFWTMSHERRWKHWLVQPEARYWFCQSFGGHFVAAHLLGGQFNIGKFRFPLFAKDLNHYRYQGWGVGAGIGYGYSWLLGRHWNFELEIAAGYVYTRYDKYECAECGRKIEKDRPKSYVGPTKAAINIVYMF